MIKYDAGLCIVCEKCVSVCKDMIGDAVLKTVPRGGEAVPKELKETMPKDSYAMWNKLQKSVIGTVNEDDSLECQSCGECIAVCPVGALISTDFQYTANSWELTKIPVANPHSSDCSLLYYETKHGDMKNYDRKIFRVTNDSHYVALSGAARFGYDFENRVSGKDKALFDKAVSFIKNEADSIRFSSYITNEEAFILQKIKEKYNLKLINDDALAYQKFLNSYSSTSGKSLYNGTLKSIKSSNFVISVGSAVRYDAPSVGFAINNAMTMNKGAGLYFHPVGDTVVDSFSKNMTAIKNEIGSEEHVLAYVLETFSKVAQEREGSTVEKLPKEVMDIISKYDSKLLNLPEGFDLEKMLAKKDTFSLILGEDLYHHDSAENIAKLAGLISVYTDFTVNIIPSKTNTLGVALICDLDESAGSKVLGYNAEGDFVLSALGEGDLDMPALNQQEGTYTNLDKKVVPTNAALPYSGYELTDIANALGFKEALVIDFTPQLPTKNGYMIAEFDALANYYDNAGNEVRGYDLNVKSVKIEGKLEKLSSVKKLDGDVVYLSNPINQFSAFTNKAHQLNTKGAVYVSTEYLEAKGFSEGDELTVKTDAGEISAKIELDKQLSGEIIYLPTFDTDLNTKSLFNSGFRFTTATIRKA